MANYVEQDCVFQGHEAGGAVVTPDHIVAYLGAHGVLTDWHGKKLGTWRMVSEWHTPRSYVSLTMMQVEATVDGVVYTGRSAGQGMSYAGKRKTVQPK